MTLAFVLAVILGVASFDVVVGARMLASPRPFDVNGAGTLWARAGPAALERDPELVRSVFARLGAFSLHTGVATAVWAVSSIDRPGSLLALLATYTLTGLAFFHGDRKYFAGTRYFVIKQMLGALWAAALVTQAISVAS